MSGTEGTPEPRVLPCDCSCAGSEIRAAHGGVAVCTKQAQKLEAMGATLAQRNTETDSPEKCPPDCALHSHASGLKARACSQSPSSAWPAHLCRRTRSGPAQPIHIDVSQGLPPTDCFAAAAEATGPAGASSQSPTSFLSPLFPTGSQREVKLPALREIPHPTPGGFPWRRIKSKHLVLGPDPQQTRRVTPALLSHQSPGPPAAS